MDDVRGLFLVMRNGTTPAAVTTNKNIIMYAFKSSGDIQKKKVGQTAVSGNQSSSVTLNELAKKARKIYCNFVFQRRSHTMTEINLRFAESVLGLKTIRFNLEASR